MALLGIYVTFHIIQIIQLDSQDISWDEEHFFMQMAFYTSSELSSNSSNIFP